MLIGVVVGLVGCAGSTGEPGGSPTPTVTPTPAPGELGCRDIQVSVGIDGNGPDASAYYTSAIGAGTDTSEFINAGGWQVGGPLSLCGGQLTGGSAPLTLANDVTFAISLPLNNCLCRDYLASGTTGTVYCGASSDAPDLTVTLDSNAGAAAGAPQVVESGTVTDEGTVVVTFQGRAANIDADAASCTPQACATALASASVGAITYSTGTVTSEFTNTVQGGDVQISATGMPFDDDPSDGTPDCEDWTDSATPLGALAGAAEHDEDNDSIGIQDVVTVERIAE